MLSWLKKHFIPHKRNNHRPHILRYEAALVILSIVLLAEMYFLAQALLVIPATNFFASLAPDTLVSFANASRQADSLPELKTNALLAEAARLKAEDMAAKEYFAHVSPDGTEPWHWLNQAGYQYSYAGENLAVNFVDSKDVADAWMNSPTHRANILNNNFTEIGIGTAKGTYHGQETTFIVQFFGAPALAGTGVNAEKTPVKAVLPDKKKISPEEKPEDVPAPEEMYVAVKGASSENLPAEPVALAPVESAPVANAVSEFSSSAGCFFSLKCFFASPRNATNFLYFTLATILALALALKIFINIRIQHPKLIVNGIFLLLVIGAVLWVNQYIALVQAKVI